MANDNGLNERAIRADARLTVHEFVLEVMLANWLSFLAANEAEAFVAQFRQKSRKISLADTPAMNSADIDQWMGLVHSIHDALLNKAQHRSEEIRESRLRDLLSQP